MTLLSNQTTSREAIVAFEPLETIRVSATGDVVPPFGVDVRMPSRAVFAAPDLTRSELVMFNQPIEVTWIVDGPVGTVEVWAAAVFTPDAYSELAVAHCSAPLGHGRLTVPPLNINQATGPLFTRALAVRLQHTELLRVDDWAIEIATASFDSGPVAIVTRVTDAAPSISPTRCRHFGESA